MKVKDLTKKLEEYNEILEIKFLAVDSTSPGDEEEHDAEVYIDEIDFSSQGDLLILVRF